MDDDDLGTEAELAHVRRRVREIQRRAMLAKGAAVALTLLGLVLGLIAESFVHNALLFGLRPAVSAGASRGSGSSRGRRSTTSEARRAQRRRRRARRRGTIELAPDVHDAGGCRAPGDGRMLAGLGALASPLVGDEVADADARVDLVLAPTASVTPDAGRFGLAGSF